LQIQFTNEALLESLLPLEDIGKEPEPTEEETESEETTEPESEEFKKAEEEIEKVLEERKVQKTLSDF
jgi:hypothetical protein